MLHQTMWWSMKIRRQSGAMSEEEEEGCEGSTSASYHFASSFSSSDIVVGKNKDEVEWYNTTLNDVVIDENKEVEQCCVGRGREDRSGIYVDIATLYLLFLFQ